MALSPISPKPFDFLWDPVPAPFNTPSKGVLILKMSPRRGKKKKKKKKKEKRKKEKKREKKRKNKINCNANLQNHQGIKLEVSDGSHGK